MERLYEFFVQAGVRCKKNEPLAPHSSFRIGGAAELALFPESRDEMMLCLSALSAQNIKYAVIGNASNVVFPDEGIGGAVVFCGGWKELSIEGNTMTVSAGVSLAMAAAEAQRAGLAGLEFAHGIPATVGGAVVMNAGAFGGSMADVCVKTAYFDPADGKCHTLCGADHAFAYRNSIYKQRPQYTVLSATFALTPDDGDAIAARMKDYIERRRSTQPLEFPSAGSVFKHPVGHFAGKLIEDAGLKGTRIGGAEVSEKHAGFIINRGDATARDVRELVALIKLRVFERFGVELECEICFL